MKRTFPWALFALFPLAYLVDDTAYEQHEEPHLSRLAEDSGASAFVTLYWWAVVFAIILAQTIGFAVAALRNRALPRWVRFLWSAALVVFGPVSAPAYWWLHSGSGKSVAL